MRIEDSPFERYLDHINECGCWITWLAPNSAGYGTIWSTTKKATRKKIGLHVASYQYYVGEIPAGFVMDHVECGNKLCFNPEHLEPVTFVENMKRANRRLKGLPYSCGHPRIAQNTVLNGRTRNGAQAYRCRACVINRRYKGQIAS